jgi:hypothetical protein
MQEEIKIHCLFCKSDQFELPTEGHQPNPGEMIKCATCGRLNDYTSMLKVVEEQAVQMVEAEAEKIVREAFKSFKL